MLTLHLGVNDVPYMSFQGRKVSPLTTYDVAMILEAKYGIMATFYRVKERKIAEAIENSLSGAMRELLQNKKAIDPWGAAMQTVMAEFRNFINSGEAERSSIPGTPTKAALAGINHRLKHPYAKRNARRPSFRDTGLYVTSFRAEID